MLSLFIGVLALAGYSQDTTNMIRLSDDLQIVPLSANACLHVSWSTLPEYGRFSDNGLIYINNKEAVIFDTPPKTFHANGITSYAHQLTNQLIRSDSVERPQKNFSKMLRIRIGKEDILCQYFGEGHSISPPVNGRMQEAT